MSEPDPNRCANCGVTNPYGAEYCFSCGQRLTGRRPPPPGAEQLALSAPAPPYFSPGAQADGEPVSMSELLGWGCAAFVIPLVGLILPIVWLTQRRPGALGCLIAYLVVSIAIPIVALIIAVLVFGFGTALSSF